MKLDIQGQIVNVPDNMPEDQIAKIVAEVKASRTASSPTLATKGASGSWDDSESPPTQPTAPPKQTTTTGAYVANQAKKGILGGVKAFGGLVRGAATAATGGSFAEGFNEVQAGGDTFATEVLGAKDLAPANETQNFLGRVAEGGSDATNWVPGLGIVTRGVKGVMALGGAAAKSAAVGAGANVGAGYAGDMAKGSGSTTEMVTQIMGGLLGARGASGMTEVAKVTPKVLAAGKTMGGNFMAKYLPGGIDTSSVDNNITAANEAMKARAVASSNRRVDNELKQAIVEGEGNPRSLQESLAAKGQFEEQIGASLPPTVLQGENRVIKEQIAEAAEQPKFRAEINSMTEKAQTALKSTADSTFGSRDTALDTLDSVVPNSVNKRTKLESELEASNLKIKQLEDSLIKNAEGSEAVGKKMADAYADNKKMAKAQATEDYNAVKKAATDAGLKLPATTYAPVIGKALIGSADALKFADTGPVGQWLGVLKKKVLADEDLLPYEVMAFKEATNKALRQAEKAPSPDGRLIDELRSIKEMIVGKDLTPQDLKPDGTPLLPTLLPVDPKTNRVPGLADLMSPQFAQGLKDADAKYAKNVGADIMSTTGRAIGREEFESRIVPRVLYAPEAAEQAIVAMGPKGTALVKDALMSELSKKVGAGDLTDKALSKFYEQHKQVIAKVPGLKESLSSKVEALTALTTGKVLLKQRHAEAAKEDILANFQRTFAPNDPNAAGQSVRKYTDSAELAKAVRADGSTLKAFLKQYGNNKDAVESLRTTVLQDYLNVPNSAEVLMAEMKSNRALANFLEPKMKQFYDFAYYAEKLATSKAIPQGSVLKGAPGDFLQEMGGPKASKVISNFKNSITSVFFKGTVTAGDFLKAAEVSERGRVLVDTLLKPGVLDASIDRLSAAVKADNAFSVDSNVKGFLGTMKALMVPTKQDAVKGLREGINEPVEGREGGLPSEEYIQKLDREQAEREAKYGR